MIVRHADSGAANTATGCELGKGRSCTFLAPRLLLPGGGQGRSSDRATLGRSGDNDLAPADEALARPRGHALEIAAAAALRLTPRRRSAKFAAACALSDRNCGTSVTACDAGSDTSCQAVPNAIHGLRPRILSEHCAIAKSRGIENERRRNPHCAPS